MNNIDVIYTPWDNLKKTGGMDVGQVGFKDEKKVKKVIFLGTKMVILLGHLYIS